MGTAIRRSSATARGRVQRVLCTYPLEYMASQIPAANPESTWRLYGGLAEAAGVVRPVRVDDPRVLTGMLRAHDGRETVVFVNASPDRVVTTPVTSLDLELGRDGELVLERFETAAIAVAGCSELSSRLGRGSRGRGRSRGR